MRDPGQRYVDPTPLEVQWMQEAMVASATDVPLADLLDELERTGPDQELLGLVAEYLATSI
jgi:hypothetical protein